MLETTCDEEKARHVKRGKCGQRPRETKECTEQRRTERYDGSEE